MMILGISGFKGSGKDEFYKVISELEPTYKKLAFADPIKKQVMNVFNLADEAAYDDFKRDTIVYGSGNVDGRHVVREIGMLMRSYNVNQFIEYVYGNLTVNTCITDLRFHNELTFLKKLKRREEGVYLIKIKRYNSDDEHITERELPDEMYDYVIENDGTIEEYHEKIKDLYKGLVNGNL